MPPVPAARGIARTSEGGGEIHPGSGLRQIDRSRWMGMAPAGWVAGLVAESFFVACPAHESRKKNERNIFCLACCASICPHCGPAHRHHPLLQVSLVSSRRPASSLSLPSVSSSSSSSRLPLMPCHGMHLLPDTTICLATVQRDDRSIPTLAPSDDRSICSNSSPSTYSKQ